MDTMSEPLKVFISYKREDSVRNAWVTRLATDLRAAGIDAILYIWEVRLGESFTDYMAMKIKDCDALLFVITEASVKTVESPSYGALKFELQMALARRIAGESFRLIGVYREGPAPPVHLRDNRYVDFRDDSQYDAALTELIKDLLGVSDRPPLTRRIALLHRSLAEVEALLPRHPDDAALLSAYLKLVQKEGTTSQISAAIERARAWVAEHPGDTYVGRAYARMTSLRGTKTQFDEMIAFFEEWLQRPSRDDYGSMRSGFLGAVARSRYVTSEQLTAILKQTQDWLARRPDDVHVRVAFLGLVEKRGTAADIETAIEATREWLMDAEHSEDTHVRQAYLGLVRKRGTIAQIESAIIETQSWLAAHPDDLGVRQAYVALKGPR
jgi:hypothetical protein